MDGPPETRCPDPDADVWQPRLHWYSHLWRDLLAVAIGLVLWLPNVAQAQLSGDRPYLFWLDMGVALGCLVLVHWRRRWPLAVAIVTSLCWPISTLSGGASTLAVVSLATRRQLWPLIGIGVLGFALAWPYYAIQPTPREPLWLEIPVSVVVVGGTIAWGMFIGSRRELVWTLRQRAEAAEAERDVRAREARTNERARIAREMHDVLAHRISQISMHAGALSYREDLDADEMRSSAGVIRETAHKALTDLRGVLGVLREGAEDGDAATAPQPTHNDLPALLDDARAAGTTIEYDAFLPDETPLPDAVGRTAYRVVQEGITNARKHAPGSRLRIRLGGSPEEGLQVTLRNPLGFGDSGTPGAGLGLIGLAERTALRGGRLDHGVEPAPEGPTFVLQAWLPWAA